MRWLFRTGDHRFRDRGRGLRATWCFCHRPPGARWLQAEYGSDTLSGDIELPLFVIISCHRVSWASNSVVKWLCSLQPKPTPVGVAILASKDAHVSIPVRGRCIIHLLFTLTHPWLQKYGFITSGIKYRHRYPFRSVRDSVGGSLTATTDAAYEALSILLQSSRWSCCIRWCNLRFSAGVPPIRKIANTFSLV